ncbi:MAG: hypothetical protein WBM28_14755 [Burkholderiales bacterium]
MRRSRIRYLSLCLRAVLSAVGAGLPLAAVAAGTLTISQKAPYEKDSRVPDAVRAECGLEQKIPEALKKELGDKAALANGVSARTAGRALEMKITHVLAPGGGSWSGPKSLAVHGTLYENGKQVGSFTVRRNTIRGAGTCNMLERDINEIAGDIKKWLESPGKEDLLGDAK